MRRYTIEIGDRQYLIDVQELTLERFTVQVDGQQFEVRLAADESLAGAAITPAIAPLADGAPPPVALAPSTLSAAPAAPAAPIADGDATQLRAPMPGTILAVLVAPGERVAAGQPLLTLEAMKMQNSLRAPRAATVAALLVQAGQQVAHGDPLLAFVEEPR
jgi:glutaconyl-CoA/methylmalonyl-CoA decarboxylase subunit gamma